MLKSEEHPNMPLAIDRVGHNASCGCRTAAESGGKSEASDMFLTTVKNRSNWNPTKYEIRIVGCGLHVDQR